MAKIPMERIRQAVIEALAVEASRREAFVRESCGTDRELAEEVMTLLGHDAEQQEFTDRESTTRGFEFAIGESIGDLLTLDGEGLLPSSIGKFQILCKLGEGGTGEVYLARQTAPVERDVALKVIRPGMGSQEVLARFQSEQRALALMSHPNIAAVYDAGMTEGGQPFFVLEYVSGAALTAHCEEHALNIRQRLELFLTVCNGVQHAHQKGIVHRDLKPNNILVANVDGTATPKIIDFGISKVVGSNLERSLQTQVGQLLGTIGYMSPEQAALGSLDIDTRTDVYSLGVLLYELLTGTLPMNDPTESKAFDEQLRSIRTEDPERPSTRARRSDSSGPNSPAERVEEDLDWIVLRAMAKERDDRYSSPSELAADISRHLVDLPVEATPPTRRYQAAKFVRRNRPAVIAATAVLMALIGGLAIAMLGMQRAVVAEREAVRQSETTDASMEFMIDLFAVSDPGVARGNSITAREVLDRGAERIRSELQDQPEVSSTLMGAMGEVYANLGLYKIGRDLYAEALRTRSRIGESENEWTLDTEFSLAGLEVELGNSSVADSMLTLLAEHRIALFGEHEVGVASIFNTLGASYRNQGRYTEAEPAYLKSLAIREDVLGSDHADVAQSLNNLGGLYYYQGRYAEVEPMWIRALDIRTATYGRMHSRVATTLSNLGALYSRLGDFEISERYQLESLAIREELLGPDNVRTAASVQNLGSLCLAQQRFPEAVTYFLRALKIRKQELGAKHINVAWSQSYLAACYNRLGRAGEAKALLDEAIGIARDAVASTHVIVAYCHYELGVSHLQLENVELARSHAEQSLSIRLELLGEEHEDTQATRALLAELASR